MTQPRTQAADPAFTVVMPAHNAAETIGSAIGSLLKQTRPDFELIVVDDGSRDATSEVVAGIGDPRIRLLSQPNRGPAAARNAGIAAGRAPLVSFMDADDLWLPNFLEVKAQTLAAAPDAGMAYTDAWRMEHDTRRVRVEPFSAAHAPAQPPATAAEMLEVLLRGGNFIFTSVTLRRWVLDQVGGQDERLQALVDYELWLRVAAAGIRAVRAPGRLALYIPRATSISYDRGKVARNQVALWKLVAEEYDLPEHLRAPLRERARRWEREVALHQGARPAAAAARRARLRLGRVKRAVLRQPRTFARPPRELVEAFGDLAKV